MVSTAFNVIVDSQIVHSWKDGVGGRVDSGVAQLEDGNGQGSQPGW